eukprot:750614-Hanusia_phi.AAC.1
MAKASMQQRIYRRVRRSGDGKRRGPGEGQGPGRGRGRRRRCAEKERWGGGVGGSSEGCELTWKERRRTHKLLSLMGPKIRRVKLTLRAKSEEYQSRREKRQGRGAPGNKRGRRRRRRRRKEGKDTRIRTRTRMAKEEGWGYFRHTVHHQVEVFFLSFKQFGLEVVTGQ